jgi:Zn-dependent protease with chaperone function
MQNDALKVSENFKKMAVKAVFSILVFFLTYFVMIALGLLIIALCGLIAYSLVMLKAMSITIMLGLGFIGMGFLIFFFLIKFVFSTGKKVDRSHLTEISGQQQPELFQLIHEIVKEVQTSFPKKVYLSSEVNASVFYDSTFWSMFFPVKKNLQIGIGLMNSITISELKAVLAHEFGHFSQRSMKVGSYVYNVNKVIHNMLYDNESYGQVLNNWGNISSYFTLFSSAAIYVITGIQWVLMKVYNVINLNYMALSREMEFHADAVAARVAGSAALANSLLRLDLASQSLNTVFNYYNEKIAESQKTNNFFPQQSFVLHQYALSDQIPISNDLPILSIDLYKKFSKTKLVLEDQWSSHPSTEERVNRLLALNEEPKDCREGLAIDLLSNRDSVLEHISQRLFESVSFDKEPEILDISAFKDDYFKLIAERAYPTVFKGYFDNRNPYRGFSVNDFEQPISEHLSTFDQLINDETVADLNTYSIAVQDKETIERIRDGVLIVDTFDYDGVKYLSGDVYPLINFLQGEIERLESSFELCDEQLFRYFTWVADKLGCMESFRECAIVYQESAIRLDVQRDAYFNLAAASNFMHTSTPTATIPALVKVVKEAELPFKSEVQLLLDDISYSLFIDTEMHARFVSYLSSDWSYFGSVGLYFQAEVDALFGAMIDFSSVVFQRLWIEKKSFLEFKAGLIADASHLIC